MQYAGCIKKIDLIDVNTSGLPAQLRRALSKMAERCVCLLIKLSADQYCYVCKAKNYEPAV